MSLFNKVSAFHIRTLVFAVCALSLTGCASFGNRKVDSWFNGVPSKFYDESSGLPVSDDQYYEISASRLAAAEYWLKDRPVVKLDAREAGSLGRPNFTCPKGMTPYLVRVIYDNSGGTFSVVRVGTALWISEYSLGGGGAMQRTGFVVCLDFKPTAIYHSLGGAL